MFKYSSVLISLILFSCSGIPRRDISTTQSSIQDCGSAPNCVSSLATLSDRKVSPIEFRGNLKDFQKSAQAILNSFPRSEIVRAEENYFHFVFTSAFFRFKDDVEIYFNEAQSLIDVRSASRIGYYDFGANKKRVDNLKQHFTKTTSN